MRKYQVSERRRAAVQTAPTSRVERRRAYGAVGDFYYHVMQGVVTGTQAGRLGEGVVRRGGRPDERLVHVRREGRSRRTGCSCWRPRTTPASRRSTRRTRGPAYLSYYLDALAANGIARRRVRRRRERPRGAERARRALPLQGRDLVHGRRHDHARAGHGCRARRRGSRTTSCSPYASTSTRAAGCSTRASTPGLQYAQGYEFNLETNAPCDPDSDGGRLPARSSDDFLQYYLGAYIYNEDAGTTAKGKLYDVHRRRRPVHRARAGRSGRRAPTTRTTRASFITTSGILPKAQFPQFDSWAAAKYDAARRAVRPAHGHALRVLEDRGHQSTSA